MTSLSPIHQIDGSLFLFFLSVDSGIVVWILSFIEGNSRKKNVWQNTTRLFDFRNHKWLYITIISNQSIFFSSAICKIVQSHKHWMNNNEWIRRTQYDIYAIVTKHQSSSHTIEVRTRMGLPKRHENINYKNTKFTSRRLYFFFSSKYMYIRDIYHFYISSSWLVVVVVIWSWFWLIYCSLCGTRTTTTKIYLSRRRRRQQRRRRWNRQTTTTEFTTSLIFWYTIYLCMPHTHIYLRFCSYIFFSILFITHALHIQPCIY